MKGIQDRLVNQVVPNSLPRKPSRTKQEDFLDYKVSRQSSSHQQYNLMIEALPNQILFLFQ